MNNKLILVPSESMDGNKKPDRDENSLLRVPKAVRDSLDIQNDIISLTAADKKAELKLFKAFSKDLIKMRELILEGLLEPADISRVAFVSSKTFKTMGGEGSVLDLSKIAPAVLKKVGFPEISKLLIGTDPELLLINNGNVMSAAEIPGFSKTTPFGYDGPMAELRPEPALTAEGLVSNIRKILEDKQVQEKVKNFELMSTCYHEDEKRDYPVGTHIHIDNTPEINNLPHEKRMRLFAVTNKLLDELLTLPMIRLDGPKGHNRRAKCKMSAANGFGGQYGKGYGYFGEWRGDKGRLEHRSLSGLVIATPDIAEAVFGTAKAIAEAAYNEALKNELDAEFILPKQFSKTVLYSPEFNKWDKIPLAATLGCTTSSAQMHNLMDSSDRALVTQKYIKQWLTVMQSLTTYKKYSKYVEKLAEILSASDNALDKIAKNLNKTWKE